MDFKPVLRSLMELFPQMDARILKAVAIEHSNDVDAAAEFILCEVLPSLSGPSDASYSGHDTHEVPSDDQLKEHDSSNQGDETVQPEPIARGTSNFDDSVNFTPAFSGKSKETIVDVETVNRYSSLSPEGSLDLVGNLSPVNDINRSVSEYEYEELLSRCLTVCAGTESVALESACDMSSSVNENGMDPVECGAEVPTDTNGALGGSEVHSILSATGCEQLACNAHVASREGDDLPTILSTLSGHFVNIDLLDNFIADCKDDKKTLVSALESVVHMIKEAELLEGRAKNARDEAFSAGEDTLAKVEELNHMFQHAKQANDMYAGEVHGEKAILSTEARELQARLLNMSDEKNRSFSIIEEIRKTLDARLIAAKDEIAEAEKEKLEKEGLAQKALKEQQESIDALVQESKKIQREAEENAKLREFLVDRGRIVDALQGEIAVICEDVISLKKRVEAHAPLKGSLLMTTYGSSSSSPLCHESTSSTDGLLLVEEPGKNNGACSEEDHLESREQERMVTISSNEKGKDGNEQKLTSDDDDGGWEFLKHVRCPF